MAELEIGAISVIDRREEFNGVYRWRELADIECLAIHHVGANDDDGNPVEVDSTAESIDRYHRETLGWPGPGYHFLVHWDGRIEYMGDILTVRYNVGGQNRRVIGINLSGNWNRIRPPDEQIEAARALCANLQYTLGWFSPILGHRELPGAATSCPGETSIGESGWLQSLRAGLEG